MRRRGGVVTAPTAQLAHALYYLRMARKAPTRAMAMLALETADEELTEAITAAGHAPGHTVAGAMALHALLCGQPANGALAQVAAQAEAGEAKRPTAKLPPPAPYDDLPSVQPKRRK